MVMALKHADSRLKRLDPAFAHVFRLTGAMGVLGIGREDLKLAVQLAFVMIEPVDFPL